MFLKFVIITPDIKKFFTHGGLLFNIMFVGRDKELETLERIYNQSGFQVVIVSGARGVGKTALVEEFCKRRENIFFMASYESGLKNLLNFSIMVRKHYNDEDKTPFQFWKTALSYVSEKSNGKRIIVVLDNFTNLSDRNLAFTSSLKSFAEKEGRESNIMLILSSSDVNFCRSFIIGDNCDSRLVYASLFLDQIKEDDVNNFTMNVEKPKMLKFSADEVVLRQGEVNKDMYKIVSGNAVCYFNYGTDEELVIGNLKDSNTFGEYSLLTDEPEIYTVVAFSDLLVLRIGRSEFEKFITLNASNSIEIMKNMASMLHVMKVNIDMLNGEKEA